MRGEELGDAEVGMRPATLQAPRRQRDDGRVRDEGYLTDACSAEEGRAVVEGATGQNQCSGSIQTVTPIIRPMTGPISRGTPVSDHSSSYISANEMNHSGPAKRRFMRLIVDPAARARERVARTA